MNAKLSILKIPAFSIFFYLSIITVCLPFVRSANQNCDENEIECIDNSVGFDLFWCCPADSLCGSIAGWCDESQTTSSVTPLSTTSSTLTEDTPTTSSTVPGDSPTTTSTEDNSSTTTISESFSTTTIFTYCNENEIDCFDDSNGHDQWWCCPEDTPFCGTGQNVLGCFTENSITTTEPSSESGLYIPGSPDPPDGTTDIPSEYEFKWSGGHSDPDEPVTYDFYIGTDNDPPLMSFDRSEPWINVDGMGPSITYYWKVVAKDSLGNNAEGPLWSFTTASSGICAASFVFNENPETLDELRTFRDEILMRTPAGREYVKLFYRHSTELVSIMLANSEIRYETQRIIYKILPSFLSLTENRGINIDNKTIDEIVEICDTIKKLAGPELSVDIELLKRQFSGNKIARIIKGS